MLALVWFPGYDVFFQMAITSFWWGLAILAALVALLPVILLVGLIFGLAWCIIREM